MPSNDLATHLYEQVLAIISKHPSDRTAAEIGRVLPWFQKKSEVFKQLRNEVIQDIVKNCEFKSVKKDTVIIKQGDKGDCFFIILSGSVAILINTTFGSEEEQTENETENTQSGNEKIKKPDKKKEDKLDRSIYGNYVGKIDSGKSFGELALINADCVRNATIIADETTDLVVVNRELYNRSLHSFQAKEFEERKQFVEQHPLFSNWQPKYKKQMAMSLRKETIVFDSPIIKQGTPVDGLCFILSGQAKLECDPYMHTIQYPCYFPLPDIKDLEKVEARESLRRELSMIPQKPEDIKFSSVRIGSKSPPTEGRNNGKRSPQCHRNIQISLIGAVEIIGDLELTHGLTSYAQSVTCTEQAQIYILDQKNYDRLIEKRNPQVIDIMKENVRKKYSVRLSRLSKKQIPLIRYFLYKMDEKDRVQELKSSIKSFPDRHINNDWMQMDSSKRGPIIDMYGPGSVFYSIRMKEKQRKLEKLRFGDPKNSNNRFEKPVKNKKSFAVPLSAVSQEEDKVDSFLDKLNEKENQDGYTLMPRLLCEQDRFQRSVHHGTTSRHVFMDRESNDDVMRKLEARIEAWHTSLPANDKKEVKRAVKLHRPAFEESRTPIPGKKVVLHPKTRNKFVIEEHHQENENNSQYTRHRKKETKTATLLPL